MIRRSDGLPLVMGVVNVTPDSFSDGGEWFEPDAAIAHGRDLHRPGRRPPRRRWRVHPARRRAARASRRSCAACCPSSRSSPAAGRVVSVDTMRAEVAARALAGRRLRRQRRQRRPGRPRHGRGRGRCRSVPFVAMHWRGAQPRHAVPGRRTTTWSARCVPSCPRGSSELQAQRRSPRSSSSSTPGFGFAKLAAHNWSLLRHLDQVAGARLPRPRRHLAQVVPRAGWAWPRAARHGPPLERDVATAATSMYAARPGRGAVRVHHVPSTLDALRVVAAMEEAPMTDRIVLQGVRAKGFHGVLEYEKREGQEFVVDVRHGRRPRAGRGQRRPRRHRQLRRGGRRRRRPDRGRVPRPDRGPRRAGSPEPCSPGRWSRPSRSSCTSRRRPSAPRSATCRCVCGASARPRWSSPSAPTSATSVDTLHDAAVALLGLMDIEAVSPVVETDPVGGPDQPAYLNAVAAGHHALAPWALLRFLHDIEREHGRTREVRWGPRTLDLDLIQYGDPVFNTDVQMDDPTLTLPAPAGPRARLRPRAVAPGRPRGRAARRGARFAGWPTCSRAWTRPACVPGLTATCWTTRGEPGPRAAPGAPRGR